MCCGPSVGKRFGSLAGDPIVKLPGGTTIICGQLLHSVKVSFGLSPRARSGDSVETMFVLGATGIGSGALGAGIGGALMFHAANAPSTAILTKDATSGVGRDGGHSAEAAECQSRRRRFPASVLRFGSASRGRVTSAGDSFLCMPMCHTLLCLLPPEGRTSRWSAGRQQCLAPASEVARPGKPSEFAGVEIEPLNGVGQSAVRLASLFRKVFECQAEIE